MTKGALPLFGPEEGGALSSGNRDPRRAYDARLTTAGVDPEVDVASEFLLKTLVKRVVVREVGGVAFMTARTWRAPVKDLQIKSLRILKQSLPPRFVEEAGRDLAAAARKLNGDRAFSFVVPVPCGHSGREDCFSYRLGDQVARELDAGFGDVLESRPVKGSSHPRQSQKFVKPKVKLAVRGKVLVVDDVCTTGRHLSLSVSALRGGGADAFGLAWIGPR